MAVIGGAAHVWGALAGAAVITVLKQWPQGTLPQLFGASGNFEVIAFGLLMIVVLHRAREGLWPRLARLVPASWCRPASADFQAAPLARRPVPAPGCWSSRTWNSSWTWRTASW